MIWAVAPRRLVCQPLLWAPLIEFGHRVHGLGVVLRVAIVAVFTAMLLALVWMPEVAESTVGILNAYPFWVFVITGIHAATVVLGRRSALLQELPRSWLASLPISVGQQRLAVFLRALLPVFWRCVLVCLIVAMLGLGVEGATASAFALFVPPIGGYLTGAVIGLIMPLPRPAISLPGSRYVPGTPLRASKPSLRALGRWTVAHAFATLNPRTSSRAVLPVLLAVPSGVSIGIVLLTIFGWMIAVYALFLLRAILQVSRKADVWLRSTPIHRLPMVTAITGRAILHQSLVAAAVLFCLLALDVPVGYSVGWVLAWLAVVLGVSGSTLIIGGRRRAGR